MKREWEIRALLRQREFVKLWLGNTISRLGDSIDSIAFGWLVYQLTGSGLLMGTVWAVNALPNLLLGPLAGVLVDRWHKKPVMLIADIGRGITVTVTAVLLATGRISVLYLYIFTAINSTLESFAVPARMAVLPRLVPKELVLSANGVGRGFGSLAELVGLGLAGTIIGVWGIPAAIAIDAASFLICAVCVALARIPTLAGETRISPVALPDFTRDLRSGVATAFGNGLIRLCIMLGLAVSVLSSPFHIFMPIYSDRILLAGSQGFSILSMGGTIGVLVGAFAAGPAGRRLGRDRTLLVSLCIVGSGFVGFAVARSLIAADIVAIMFGAGVALANTAATTIVMTTCPPELLGRVSSVMNSGVMAGAPIGTALAGLAVDTWSLTPIFLVMAVAMLAMPLLVAGPLRRYTAAPSTDAKAQAEIA